MKLPKAEYPEETCMRRLGGMSVSPVKFGGHDPNFRKLGHVPRTYISRIAGHVPEFLYP